ncbi:MAG: short chain dehydrogenase [Balneolaceae bacterium]|nr:short chain dehydrogenase [Balneolaceae bacterium]
MRILVVGGNGTIGKRICEALKEEHEVIIASRNSGDVQVDITDSASIKTMFQSIYTVDAIVSVAGEAKWASFSELSEEDYYIGIRSKLMGQVNLARMGLDYLSDGGSITLTTGILADHPVLKTSSAAMVNGAIHSFVKASALEIKHARINAVSLGMVEDAYEKYHYYFPGHNTVPNKRVVNAFLKSILGAETGSIIIDYP